MVMVGRSFREREEKREDSVFSFYCVHYSRQVWNSVEEQRETEGRGVAGGRNMLSGRNENGGGCHDKARNIKHVKAKVDGKIIKKKAG